MSSQRPAPVGTRPASSRDLASQDWLRGESPCGHEVIKAINQQALAVIDSAVSCPAPENMLDTIATQEYDSSRIPIAHLKLDNSCVWFGLKRMIGLNSR